MAAISTRKPAPDAKIRVPRYRLHRPSGRAVVTLGGRDFYLGTHGSAASKAEYRRLIAEYLARGGAGPAPTAAALTIDELVDRYWRHVKRYYTAATRDGTIKPTLRRLRAVYGRTIVAEFGPLRLRAFRDGLVGVKSKRGKPLSRRYINRSVQVVRAMFRWAVAEELVPPSVLHGLSAVDGLRYGRTEAPERSPVAPVDDADVEATLPHLSCVVADMIRVQRLTGMRPGEVCRLNWGEIDRSGEVWWYRPNQHKTAHLGRTRCVPLGPRCQDILSRYLTLDPGRAIFRPADALEELRDKRRASNRTPFTPSRRARDLARARQPTRRVGAAYTPCSYALAIRRACEAAGIKPHWTPNQLRHTKATELRREFGLDAAGAVLGHSRLETTQIYAERAEALAERVAHATA